MRVIGRSLVRVANGIERPLQAMLGRRQELQCVGLRCELHTANMLVAK